MTWAGNRQPQPYPSERGVRGWRLLWMPMNRPRKPPREPHLQRRKSPGKIGCEQCEAAGGFCSEHVGFYEEYDPVASLPFGNAGDGWMD